MVFSCKCIQHPRFWVGGHCMFGALGHECLKGLQQIRDSLLHPTSWPVLLQRQRKAQVKPEQGIQMSEFKYVLQGYRNGPMATKG